MTTLRPPFENVRRPQNRNQIIDVHETMKKEIYRQGAEGDNGIRFALGSIPGTNPLATAPGAVAAEPKPHGFEEIELYFDSTQRNMSSDLKSGEILFDVSVLNNSTDIKNCVEMKISEFYFPNIYGPTGGPDFFYFNRAFIEFFGQTPSDQAILGPNNNKFHWEFEVDNLSGQAVKFIPLKPSFFFKRPITSITNFYVRFTVPPTISTPDRTTSFNRISIPPDTVTIRAVSGTNPIRFQITSPGITTSALGPIGTLTAPGIAVLISGFASNDPTTNAAVNLATGVFVTNIVDATTFEVGAINGTAVSGTYDSQMYIWKNRIAFTVRFTTVQERKTNYVGVTHD